ncbi:GDSL esterase/lipase [Rhynchospora pubera]|uniref:GDSL esterase/lipase n=1 Tax=Rhynchospora pubera TaxID=906938 RepID=A0AAV8CS48_9POAL|nr:GDSL esterase/lipase [Rhynchospora pubera]
MNYPVVLFSLFGALLISIDTVQSLSSFDRVFSFGDSMADTGNACRSMGAQNCPAMKAPYGETYFHQPNGRWSDGRVVADFIAQAYGLAPMPPSMGGNTPEYFQNGASFAVAAARALNNSAYKTVTGMDPPDQNDFSLGTQFRSFKDLLPTISQGSSVDCVMSSSLFIVGEIGGVEYLFGFSKNKSVAEMKSWVPYIVAAISSAVNDLINLGATTLIVPGNYAVGCAPGYMTIFQSDNPADYDILTGCLKRLNKFTVYHNTMLMKELVKLRLLHPLANIIYADYYGAQSQLYLNKLDFPAPLYACCGGPGPYNSSLQCGVQGSQTCPNPENYISWDGGHLTEAANNAIANGILYGPFAFPPL